MVHRFWRRNIAHIVGWVVVVVGVTTLGVANALPGQNTVDSGDIIDGQVKRVDIAGGAVNSAKVANESLTGDDIANGSIGVSDLGPALKPSYFARVGDNGTKAVLVEGRGVKSVSNDDWNYYVTFNNRVDKCAWTASINPFYGGPPNGFGAILVGPDWDNTVVPPQNQTPNPRVLRVMLLDSEGQNLTPATAGAPGQARLQTFTVSVNC